MKASIILPFTILGFLVSAVVAQADKDANILPDRVTPSISNTKVIKDEADLNSAIAKLENEVKKTNALVEDQARKVEELTAKVEPVSVTSVNGVSSYTEWVVITLAVLAVMIAVFTVGLSILAFIGYRNIKRNAVRQAEDEVKKQLADDGELRPFVEQILENAANRFLYPPFDDLDPNDEFEPDDE